MNEGGRGRDFGVRYMLLEKVEASPGGGGTCIYYIDRRIMAQTIDSVLHIVLTCRYLVMCGII